MLKMINILGKTEETMTRVMTWQLKGTGGSSALTKTMD